MSSSLKNTTETEAPVTERQPVADEGTVTEATDALSHLSCAERMLVLTLHTWAFDRCAMLRQLHRIEDMPERERVSQGKWLLDQIADLVLQMRELEAKAFRPSNIREMVQTLSEDAHMRHHRPEAAASN